MGVLDYAEKGRHRWFLNINEAATESKRAVFPERMPLPFGKPQGGLTRFCLGWNSRKEKLDLTFSLPETAAVPPPPDILVISTELLESEAAQS
ncbi:hypothetical protein PFLUV_G00031820 [Perca fluviatilis]|uniref:Uncharacterized protein n=1 Tax=Perca fluviatilis TaxID=8168 RepID=A0A6A5EU03_PERFL|nr:hypothetical protein PFLUV_G00031820 [Perca fluviatilis]